MAQAGSGARLLLLARLDLQLRVPHGARVGMSAAQVRSA